LNKEQRLIAGIIFLGVILLIFPTLFSRLGDNLVAISLSHRIAPTGEEMLDITLSREEKMNIAAAFPDQNKLAKHRTSLQYRLAQLAYWSGDFDETIFHSREAVDRDVSILAKFLEGNALWHLGRQVEALETWRKLPNIDRYFFNQAMWYENQREYDLVERYNGYLQVLVPNSQSAEAGYWFAKSMQSIPQSEAETPHLESIVRKAKELNVSSEQRLMRMGAALYDKRFLVLAKECLEIAVELGDVSYWSHFQLGLVYYSNQEYSLAIERLLYTLTINPEFGRAYLYLARSYVRLGDPEAAIPYYHESIRLLPHENGLEKELNQVISQIMTDG
jgi:tetratricopeptide (TPR) repeat protein